MLLFSRHSTCWPLDESSLSTTTISSTAVVGALSHVHVTVSQKPGRSTPLVVVVLLLTWLGAGGARTDVLSHGTGFVTGLALGVLAGPLAARPASHGVRVLCGVAAFAFVAIAWIVALATALIFAVAMILIRKLAQTEPTTRILFYYHLTGLGFFVAPAIWVWRTPVGEEWLFLMSIGVLTTLAMVCFVRGLAAGEASIVGPMEYTRLIYAAFFGYFLFAEVPVIWTWIGAAIIIASAFYIARREAFAGPS